MDEERIHVIVEHGHPKMGIRINDDTILTADIENRIDTAADAVYMGLQVDGKDEKKDIACIKSTNDPNIIRLCIFVNLDPDDPDKIIHDDPVYELFLDLDEIKDNME